MFQQLSDRLNNTFKSLRSKGRLSESDINDTVKEIRTALLEADVALSVANSFSEKVKEKALGQEVSQSLNPAQQVVKIVHSELVNILGGESRRLTYAKNPPTVIMLLGLQGAGKTSLAAKLAKHLVKNGHTPLLVAADLQRPNAVDQLKVVGDSVNVPVFAPFAGSGQGEALQVVKDSLKYAQDKLHNFVIIDTAGRLAVDEKLISELRQIKQLVNPTESLFVLDAMLGQSAAEVARIFQDQVGFDAIVLSKLDGDAKGGAALSVVTRTGKPIMYASVGEKPTDLENFYPDRIASRILGKGDIASLAEKAAAVVPAELNEKLTTKLVTGERFTLTDFLAQLSAMKNMGSISKIMGLLPGMNAKMTQQVNNFDDAEIVRTKAIIESMTPAEREDPSILNGSRRARIAKGSGRAVSEINRLVERFSQAQKVMRQMKQNPKAFASLAPNMPVESNPKRKKSRSGNPAKRALEEG